MDIFGHKAKIKGQAAIIAGHEAKIAALESSELNLMVQIRDMDQLIFRMSQCTSWDQMRPIFNQLQAPVEKRMSDESDRIKTLLIPEMQKAYR